MARVPQAQDIGVSSFNVGSAAQIDIGVAKEIGRAGSAIGDAVAALGGAFGELAGRVQATEQAGAYSGLMNDLYDADARIETDAIKNDAPDGSNWDNAGTQFGAYSKEWQNDPRWGMLTPKQKAQAENAYRDLSRNRVIGPSSYLERSRKAKVGFQIGKIGETAATSMGRLSLDDPRNQDIPPQVYGSRVDAERDLVFSRIDAMTGTVFNQTEAEALKEQYKAQFVQRKAEFLMRSPEGAQNFIDEYNKLPKEKLQKPSYLGAPDSKVDTGVSAGPDAPDYRGRKGPASIRYNNPGAMWPGPSSKKFGAVGHVNLKDGQGNKIAVFPTAVHGAAAQFDLLSRKYTGKTLRSAISTWSGGNSVGTYLKVLEREIGISANTKLTKEMIADPRIAIPLAKAMGVQEAGKPFPMSDKGWANAHAMFLGKSPEIVPSTSGEIQVADAEGRTVPSGMMKLGAEEVEVAKEVSDSVGLDVGRFATLPPDTKLSEAGLTPEEVSALESRFPGVDIGEVTVGEAAELVEETGFKPDMGGGSAPSMNDAPKEEQEAEEQPDLEERLVSGAEMRVKVGNGHMTFSADEMKYFTPKMMKQIERDFRARQALAKKQNQVLADEMMKAQINSWEQENKPVDPKFINQKVIDAAYPPGTPKRAAYDRKVAVLESTAKIFSTAGDKSTEELMYEVEALEPKQSSFSTPDEYNAAVAAYRSADRKLQKTLYLRDNDPAAAVESSTLVQNVLSKFEGGKPKSQAEKKMLIDARMLAQRQIGIPEDRRSPITDKEAKFYATKLRDVPEEGVPARIEELAESVKKNYGAEYTGLVVRSVIKEFVRSGAQREEMVSFAQKLVTSRDIGPMEYEDIERYQEQTAKRITNLMNWGRIQAARNQKPWRQSRPEESSPTFMGSLRAFGDVARGALSPSESKPKITKDDIASLKSSRDVTGFAKRFGITEADALRYLLETKR
jgi:hypothetical protein